MLVACDDGIVLTGEHHERLVEALPLGVEAEALEGAPADCRTVTHLGTTVSASREIAFDLRTAIRLYERVPLGDHDVELTLDDPTLLAWLRGRGGNVEVLAP